MVRQELHKSADKPEVVIYTVIDEVHDEEKKAMSSVATKLTSEILSDVLPFLGIYPEGEIDYKVDLPVNKDQSKDPNSDANSNQETGEGTSLDDFIYDPSQDEGTADVLPDESN